MLTWERLMFLDQYARDLCRREFDAMWNASPIKKPRFRKDWRMIPDSPRTLWNEEREIRAASYLLGELTWEDSRDRKLEAKRKREIYEARRKARKLASPYEPYVERVFERRY